MPQQYPKAFDADHLQSLLESNEHGPDCTGEMAQRLVTLAQQRADSRGETQLTDSTECVIATNWVGFCDDNFGHDDDTLNHFAVACHDEDASMTADADLFTDVHVVQQQWLETGDGRRTETELYVEDFDGTADGETWIGDGAQDYLCIIELDDELVCGRATAGDAF